MISTATLDKLATFDTPTICNVIELFGARGFTTGYMDGRIRAAFAELPPMVGWAVTASFRAAAPPDAGGNYGSFQQQLELMATQPGPAVVVFQDLDDPPVAATFGEVMCSTYQAFGAAGLITSGAGRDLEQVRALGFPVFTGGTICSHGYCHWLDLGQPVRVGGLMVATGDLLHGDANGVTNIPRQIAAEVADVAPELVAAEEIVLSYTKSEGEKSIAELTQRQAAMRDALDSLRQQVAKR